MKHILSKFVFIVAATLTLFATTYAVNSFASDTETLVRRCPPETLSQGHEIIRALINNEGLGATLKEQGFVEVTKITQQKLNANITRYVLDVQSCGNCLPKYGKVTIVEDMRPTHTDGPIAYTIDIKTVSAP